jgi:formylglycine-generating enzyme required for sulfatase activity
MHRPFRGKHWITFFVLPLILAVCLPIGKAAGNRQNGMTLVSARRFVVGSSDLERQDAARRFDCHPTWLGDELPQHEVDLKAFWIDRYPVTNGQYLAFVEATGHARPPWWERWGGAFPIEYVNHPVAGVSGADAAAYAMWVGKRLPSGEEWEAAIGGSDHALFPWGQQWPGPLELRPLGRIFWELPGTRPVGTGGCGRSTTGIEDFAGQVLEWVSDVRPHHGVQFQLMKGASWFHEDPVSFRTASGWYARDVWNSSFTGFRCALDGSLTPPVPPVSKPKNLLSADSAIKQLEGQAPAGPVALVAPGGTSRRLSISVPKFGRETLSLNAPETIIWNSNIVINWDKTPAMSWNSGTAQPASYEMRFDELRMDAEFPAGEDFAEQRFTATNLSGKPADFNTSSCFNLQNHPMFYDCEQFRTYALAADGKFIPMRRLSRRGECIRWITGPASTELGSPQRWAVLAVVSRDGRRIIATGRAGNASRFSTSTNTLFTCLHTNSTVRVEAGGKLTTRQFFWFLDGTLDDLLKRCRRDLELP